MSELNGNHKRCKSCDGSGIRAPATPSCEIRDIPEGYQVIERCDTCARYSDDLEAALTVAEDAQWTECQDGGSHAIGRLIGQ